MKDKKIKQKKETGDITLNSLKEILQVLGIIESKGFYFSKAFQEKPEKLVSSSRLSNILSHFNTHNGKEKMDWNRTIRNAKTLYNSLDKEFNIQGDSRGSYFVNLKNGDILPENLKTSTAYDFFLVFALAFLGMEKHLHWEFLHQLNAQKHPLALITFIGIAIEYKILLSIQYKKDRTHEEETYSEVVPGKIIYRDGHWILLLYNLKTRRWMQILLHSIVELKPNLDNMKQFQSIQDIKEPDVNRFYKNSFSIAKLDGVTPEEILIKVPKQNYEAVKKRKKEGTWEKKDNYYLWKVKTYDPMEVFTYIFKWGGILEIIEPLSMRNRFREELLKLCDLHK